MLQISLFGGSAPDPTPQPTSLKSKPQPTRAAKRVPTAVVQPIAIPSGQPQVNPAPTPAAPYGYCQICGQRIAIPGLDASLCSNPARNCGSSGWVSAPQWTATTPERRQGGGA
jgi:hypothetical protein